MNKYTIHNADDLHQEIALLTEKKNDQEIILSERAKLLYEEFHPVTIFTSALSNIFERKTDAKNLMVSALLYGIDAIVSKVWMKNSSENMKGVVSNIVQAMVAAMVSKAGKFSWNNIFGADADEAPSKDNKNEEE